MTAQAHTLKSAGFSYHQRSNNRSTLSRHTYAREHTTLAWAVVRGRIAPALNLEKMGVYIRIDEWLWVGITFAFLH